MIFVVHFRVAPGQAARLPLYRDAHRAHATSGIVKILGAGPTLSDDGQEIIGGVYIFEAEDRETARKFYDGDPYVREGLWASDVFERYDKRV